VDAIVLEYHLGLLDGAVVAAEIKKVSPYLPIVMLVDHSELPEGALKSVDALVNKSDGTQFLSATIHFVLNVNPARRAEEKLKPKPPLELRQPGWRKGLDRSRPDRSQPDLTQAAPDLAQAATDERQAPFSADVWRNILDGSVKF